LAVGIGFLEPNHQGSEQKHSQLNKL